MVFSEKIINLEEYCLSENFFTSYQILISVHINQPGKKQKYAVSQYLIFF